VGRLRNSSTPRQSGGFLYFSEVKTRARRSGGEAAAPGEQQRALSY
jgi:hypothetical protein